MPDASVGSKLFVTLGSVGAVQYRQQAQKDRAESATLRDQLAQTENQSQFSANVPALDAPYARNASRLLSRLRTTPSVSDCPFRLPGRRTHGDGAMMLALMTLSARNRLQGKITELQLGGVMAHVVIQVGNNLIESVITRRSAEEMNLKIGDAVSAVIKSTEIMIEKQ